MSKVQNYSEHRANEYDNESEFDKGNREVHVELLTDLLVYQDFRPNSFLELGCGTGFFSETILNVFPNMPSILIDGSKEMLEVAKRKFKEKSKILYTQVLLQEINWVEIPNTDLIFSALTIHHLTDDEKVELYKQIYNCLNEGGRFIYFDQFKIDNGEQDILIEYLACKNIQTRLMKEMGLDFIIDELEIDAIIKNDRRVKASENDKEALIEKTMNELREIGFKSVSIVYQEFRFFSIVITK